MSSTDLSLGPPPGDDARGLAVVRVFLKSIGYAEPRCSELLGVGEVYRMAHSTNESLKTAMPTTALAAAIRLFLLSQPVDKTALVRTIPGDVLEQMLALGLLRHRDELVEPCFCIFPCGDLFIITDMNVYRHAQQMVMPLTFESYWLARVMRDERVPRLLDLCTGSGVHAITGAAGASIVHAVDNNPRAAHFVRVNNLFNNIENVLPEVGDLFSVAQPPYDLIVAQPPFAPEAESPAGDNFWSGGASGEEVLARVIAGLPGALAAPGRALIMSLVALRTDEDIASKFRGWLGADGSDIEIVLWARWSPLLDIARQKAEHDQTWSKRLTRWADQGITGFWLAVIDLRRSCERAPQGARFQVQPDQWAYRQPPR